DQVGIDGPYLKGLAEWELEAIASRSTKSGVHGRSVTLGVEQVTVYLALHPDDEAMRKKLVDAAEGSCRLDGPHVLRISEAWSILIRQGVLHDGMTVEEARAILGAPTREGKDYLEWYVSTPRHVNPSLSARMTNGKLKEW